MAKQFAGHSYSGRRVDPGWHATPHGCGLDIPDQPFDRRLILPQWPIHPVPDRPHGPASCPGPAHYFWSHPNPDPTDASQRYAGRRRRMSARIRFCAGPGGRPDWVIRLEAAAPRRVELCERWDGFVARASGRGCRCEDLGEPGRRGSRCDLRITTCRPFGGGEGTARSKRRLGPPFTGRAGSPRKEGRGAHKAAVKAVLSVPIEAWGSGSMSDRADGRSPGRSMKSAAGAWLC